MSKEMGVGLGCLDAVVECEVRLRFLVCSQGGDGVRVVSEGSGGPG